MSLLSQFADASNHMNKRTLDNIRRRFMAINDARLTRALSRLTPKQQQFILALPLFFHVNHPQFPGFIGSDCPSGMSNYQPDRLILRLAKGYAKGFSANRELKVSEPTIEALFAMGSVGSIAHNLSSDFDCWLCHRSDLTPAELEQLQKKSEVLTEWAQKYLHLEVHIFLMSADHFTAGKSTGLSYESSGSAQHYLLLDEFYRSSIWLAGKTPAWWYVPADDEKNYQAFLNRLVQHGSVDSKRLIDFGPIYEIPAEEFIGAGCWQLFKAIESPYKSLLKLILLEVYSSRLMSDKHLPSNIGEPLALTFKRHVYNNASVDEVDTYLLLYKKIEQYLIALPDEVDAQREARLDLIRRCFYIKIGTSIQSRPINTDAEWQHRLIKNFVSGWRWTERTFVHLDNRVHWKAMDVINENNRLVKELNHSYRLLSNLSRQAKLEMAISMDELTLLARKLHTAFEKKAGKIEKINPSISWDLAEPALTFHQHQSDKGALWELYCTSAHLLPLQQSLSPVRRARSFIELLLFAKTNGLYVNGTRLDVLTQDEAYTTFQQRQLLTALEEWQESLPQITHESYHDQNKVEHLFVLINANLEPHAELHKKGLQRLSNLNDPLGFSGFRENLVLQVDVVQYSSWGELSVRHFGQDALWQSLVYWLRLMATRRKSELPQLAINCFCLGKGALIAQRIQDLWQQLTFIYSKDSGRTNARYCLEVGDGFWLIQLIQGQPCVSSFDSLHKLYDKLSEPQAEYSEIIVDPYANRLGILKAITRVKCAGDIQLFYHAEDRYSQLGKAIVYVVDEHGSLIRLYSDFKRQPVFLRPLFGFIRNTLQYQKSFTQTLRDYRMDPASIFELTSAASRVSLFPKYKISQKVLDKALLTEPYIRLKAVAEMGLENEWVYSLYCDDREFSALTYGDELFKEVAAYVVSRRPSKEPYPCYITQLDLSARSEIEAVDFKLAHYLALKTQLETQLNTALLQLQQTQK